MIIRLLFGPGSEISRDLFTTDPVIQGLVGLLGFNNEQEAAKTYMDENDVKVVSTFLKAGQCELDGLPIPPQMMDNFQYDVVGIPNDHLYICMASKKAMELSDLYSNSSESPETMEVPPDLVSLDNEFNRVFLATYNDLDQLENFTIFTVGLLDDLGNLEPAICARFEGGAKVLRDKIALLSGVTGELPQEESEDEKQDGPTA